MKELKNYHKNETKLNILSFQNNIKNALTQIGTLGGGNHFIEIQKGSDGHIWIEIHSGSETFDCQYRRTLQ